MHEGSVQMNDLSQHVPVFPGVTDVSKPMHAWMESQRASHVARVPPLITSLPKLVRPFS